MWPSATHEFCPGCKQAGSALQELRAIVGDSLDRVEIFLGVVADGVGVDAVMR